MISRRHLFELASAHPDCLAAARTWWAVADRAAWRTLVDVRRDFPAADQVGDLLIFHLRGNRYRLIVRVSYAAGRIYVKELLTHADYDRKGWMKWLS